MNTRDSPQDLPITTWVALHYMALSAHYWMSLLLKVYSSEEAISLLGISTDDLQIPITYNWGSARYSYT